MGSPFFQEVHLVLSPPDHRLGNTSTLTHLLSLKWELLPLLWVPVLTFPDMLKGDLGWKLLGILDLGSQSQCREVDKVPDAELWEAWLQILAGL